MTANSMDMPQKSWGRDGRVWMAIFAVAVVVIAVIIVREPPDKVRVNDKVFFVKLYVFSPPLPIGQGAPPLPSEWKPWLDSADKLNRILERQSADYDSISLMNPPPSDEDLAGWKRSFQEGNPTYVAACQESVCCFCTIQIQGSAEEYLYVGGRPGFVATPIREAERVSLSWFVSQNGTWKNTHSGLHSDISLIEDLLPVHIPSEMQKLVRSR